MKTLFDNVYFLQDKKIRRIYTKNLLPGKTHFSGEHTIKEGDIEFREWDPKSSKLAAAMIKGLGNFPFRKDSSILYLGASHGYTVSFLSDVCSEGRIFAVDVAPRVVRDLYFVADQRKNIAPVMADAAQPQKFYHIVPAVDIIYQDVAVKDQIGMFLKNTDLFLKKGGFAILNLKARSVDVTQRPSDVFREARKTLSRKMRIVDYRTLSPFQMDHAFFLCRKI